MVASPVVDPVAMSDLLVDKEVHNLVVVPWCVVNPIITKEVGTRVVTKVGTRVVTKEVDLTGTTRTRVGTRETRVGITRLTRVGTNPNIILMLQGPKNKTLRKLTSLMMVKMLQIQMTM
jgi:hypothetical protein